MSNELEKFKTNPLDPVKALETQKIDFSVDIDDETKQEIERLGIKMEINLKDQTFRFDNPSFPVSVNGWDPKDMNLTGIKMRLNKEKGVIILTKFYSNEEPHVYEFDQSLDLHCTSHQEENMPSLEEFRTKGIVTDCPPY